MASTDKQLAKEVALAVLADFSKQKGEIVYPNRAPKKRQEIWRQLDIVPRGIDREVVDILHRTHMGDDQDAEHLLTASMRASLADGWGGSMMATDMSDILFGTPSPAVTQSEPRRVSKTTK